MSCLPVFVTCVVVSLLVGVAVAVPQAENWPQWRGPVLNGVSGERNFPVQWSITENVAWELPTARLGGIDANRLGRSDLPQRLLKATTSISGAWIERGVRMWKRPVGGGNQCPASKTCRRLRR